MIRLDRFLVQQNIGSRSEIRDLCKKGIVTVNGQICRASDQKIDPQSDQISVNGKQIQQTDQVCYMLNKPSGYVSAVSDAHEKTVLSLMDELLQKKLFPVGRLDKDSEGLLLLTDMGKLCHDLTSPSKHVRKKYEVWITGCPDEEVLQNLRNGTDIGDETLCNPADVQIMEVVQEYALSKEQKEKLPKKTPDVITASRVHITITEGRFHQVKRMFHANRHEVFSLKRIAIGAIMLDPALEPGQYRLLTDREMQLLSDNHRQDME